MSIRAVIFEDNAHLRDSLFYLIDETEGFICAGAFADANNVYKNIESTKPDVVLMDIDMPGISGIEAVSIIKKNFPTVHVIMQTVFEDNDKIFDSICAGASGYLLKKASPARLIDAITEVMEGGAPMTGSVAKKVLKYFNDQKTEGDNYNLSAREKEILLHLVNGMSYKMIAAACFISYFTVNSHIKNIYSKLQVNSVSEAVAKAINKRIV